MCKSVFFIGFQSLRTVGKSLRSPWKVLEFYTYLPVWTLPKVRYTTTVIGIAVITCMQFHMCVKKLYIWAMAWDFQQCGMCDQQRLRPACAYAQTGQSLCWSLKYSMTFKLLTKPHLRFLSLKGGCTGSSESTLVKIPHSWKSHATAYIQAKSHYVAIRVSQP